MYIVASLQIVVATPVARYKCSNNLANTVLGNP